MPPRSTPVATLALLLGLAACASVGPLTWDQMVGTRWAEVCPDDEIATAYIRLEPDSSLAWSYTHPDSLRPSDFHSWTLDEGRLVVSWNLGGAVSHYPASSSAERAGSSTFCSDDVALVPLP